MQRTRDCGMLNPTKKSIYITLLPLKNYCGKGGGRKIIGGRGGAD